MIIVSKFKDYYDHISHQYGGGDPKVVYDRRPHAGAISEYKVRGKVYDRHEQSFFYVRPTYLPLFETPSRHWTDPSEPHRSKFLQESDRWETSWISVAGTIYPVVGRRHSTTMLSTDPEDQAIPPAVVYPGHPLWERLRPANQRSLQPYPDNAMIEVHRLANMPVLMITSLHMGDRNQLAVECKVPILREYGFASIVDPGIIWQTIAYFVGNVMHENPDMMPRTEMTDKEKLLAAGFDARQSFRHRK